MSCLSSEEPVETVAIERRPLSEANTQAVCQLGPTFASGKLMSSSTTTLPTREGRLPGNGGRVFPASPRTTRSSIPLRVLVVDHTLPAEYVSTGPLRLFELVRAMRTMDGRGDSSGCISHAAVRLPPRPPVGKGGPDSDLGAAAASRLDGRGHLRPDPGNDPVALDRRGRGG